MTTHPTNMAKPAQLKEEGNRRFQAGDYVMAEALYSQAYATLPPPFPFPLSLSPFPPPSKPPTHQPQVNKPPL